MTLYNSTIDCMHAIDVLILILILCCIIPVSITVAFITSSGTGTVGQNYSLECTVTVTGSTEEPAITWLDDGTEIISTTTRMVSEVTGSAGSYSSTLIFTPLRASDAGMLMCRATLGNATNNQTYVVAMEGEYMYNVLYFLLKNNCTIKIFKQ